MQANFNLKKFIHYGTYNPLLGATESFLISKEKQQINIKKIEKHTETSNGICHESNTNGCKTMATR